MTASLMNMEIVLLYLNAAGVFADINISSNSDAGFMLTAFLMLLTLVGFAGTAFFYLKAKASAKSSEERFSMLISSTGISSETFFICDESFTITHFCGGSDFFKNDALSDKRSIFEIISSDYACDIDAQSLENFKSGKVGKLEFDFSMHSDKNKHCLFTMQKISEDIKNYGAYLGVISDITEKIEAEKETIKAQQLMESFIERGKVINTALSGALSSNAESFVLENFLRDICIYMKADRANVYIIDEQNKIATLVDEWGVETPEEFKTLSTVKSAKAFESLRQGRIVCTNEIPGIASSSFSDMTGVLDSMDISTAFLVGVWHRGSLWGMLCFDSFSGKVFTKEDHDTALAATKVFDLYLNRRESMRGLRESEAEKALILESLNFPVILFDNKKQLKSANLHAVNLIGEDALKNTQAMPFNQIFGRTDEGACIVEKCLSEFTAQMSEISMSNGHIYHAYAYPVFDKNGKIEYALEYMMDVTELVNGKKKLEEAVKKAKAAERAKDLFLSTMSHEIRTPLNAVIGYSELNQYDHIPENDRLENLKSINFAANSLLALINDILDLSRLEAGFVDMNPQPMDIKEFLEDILRVFKYRATLKDVELVIDVASNVPVVKLDSIRLKQVMMNLVGNAVKFTDSGRVEICCQFERTPSGNANLSISVKDTGMGISPKYIDKIFSPFERQHTDIVTGKQAHEGTGLGLPIAKRLVERMNGEISLQSELGKGSVFTINLEEVELSSEEFIPKVGAPALDESSFDFDGEVLIVDDIAMNLAVFGAMLKKLGVKYRSANSGKKALEMIAEKRPYAVLTDIWMPEMGGKDLLDAIRSDASIADIPVYAVTADTRFVDDDFDGKLFKPISIDSVSKLLMSLKEGKGD